MECHDYINPSKEENERVAADPVYKLNPMEIQDFVKLRMSNKDLFGKKKVSMFGWRTVLRHMGLQDKMTHHQAAKKWENMKKKYKDLKFSGIGLYPQWRYFSLMNDAMEGRLDGSGPLLMTTVEDRLEVLNCPKRKRKNLMPSIASVESLAPSTNSPTFTVFSGPEVEVTIKEEEPVVKNPDIGHSLQKADNETDVMDRQKQIMEREYLLLQRERAGLEREAAALERDRASLDRDRAAIEREKTLLDRERAIMEREREALTKDQQALQQEKAKLVRTQNDLDNTDNVDRKERFLLLLEKLINSL